jgi:hypothetical protein
MNWRAVGFLALLVAGIPLRAPGQQAEPQPRLSVSYPGNAWSLVVDSPGFIVKMEGKKSDGREYLLANHPESNIVLTVILEQSTEPADSRTCWGFLHGRLKSMEKLNIQDVKYTDSGPLAIVEYLVPDVQGIPVNQKNFYACTTKDNTFIDIHLSKAKFQPSDESVFTEILNHVHITLGSAAESTPTNLTPPPRSGLTSSDYFRDGSRAFTAKDYRNAIVPYQRALELEKIQPTLSKNERLVLMDQLGLAFQLSGDLPHAESTFFYGVNKDPDYPMFYYHLACIYAGRNDINRTAGLLQKAFSLKANLIAGETLPDPHQDACFQPFMSDGRFLKFLQSLQKSE